MNRLRRAVVVIAIACFANVAWAYIPPSKFVIKNMASKRQGVRLVRISSQVLGYDLGKPTGLRFKCTTIYDPQTHVMKSQAFDETGVELYGIEKTGTEIALNLLVVYDSNARELTSALKRAEIPIQAEEETGASDTAVLRRWDGSIAWVFGIAPTQKNNSQIWVEKDTFLPVRLLVGDQDIQFTKYRYSQDLPYPRSTTLANRAGLVSLEEDVSELQVNPPSSVLKAPVARGYTPAGNTSPLKELIRKFYAGLR